MNAPASLAEPLPRWRLDDLYAGRDDPLLEADLATGAAINAELSALRGAFLAARGNAAALGALIDRAAALHEAATNKLWGAGAYASLAASTARDDPAWSRFEADVRIRTSQIAADSLFLPLELNQLVDAE